MKVLVVLYGIMRGNNKSIESINSKLIEPLLGTENDVDVFHFVHSIKNINNPRSGECGVINQSDSSPFINAKIFKYKDSNLHNKLDTKIINLTEDVYLDNFKSIKNLLYQLNLLKKSTYKVGYKKYDVVFLIRDDLLLNKTPNFDLELNIYKRNIYFSIWGWHGGLSDRFVAGPGVNIEILAKRYDQISPFLAENKYLHPESLVLFSLKKMGVGYIASNFKFVRCRINNKYNKENYLLPFWRPTELLRILASYIRYILLKNL